MAKLEFDKGSTSKIVTVFIRDTGTTTEVAGLMGLAFNTAGLVMYFARADDGNAGATAVTLVTATRGTWTSGGFKEKDSTNLPGVYEIGLPNAMLATGSDWVSAEIRGASGMEVVPIEIQLNTPAGAASVSAQPTQHFALYKAGSTSKRIEVFIRDSSSASGAGLTGLVFNTSNLKWYYSREDDGNAGATAVTPVTATLGTFTSSGFKEKDATNFPGVYELGIPNAVLVAGAVWSKMVLRGAANMAPCLIDIALVAYDPQDATRLGLAGIPNGPMAVKKGATKQFTFPMFSSTTHQMLAGLGSGVTAIRSIDGASTASCTNAVSEVGGGFYTILFSTSDTLGDDSMAVKFSASGADDLPYTILIQK